MALASVSSGALWGTVLEQGYIQCSKNIWVKSKPVLSTGFFDGVTTKCEQNNKEEVEK